MQNARDEAIIRAASVVIADRSPCARRLTRNMLVGLGVRSVTEVSDGPSALEAVSSGRPDALVIDWELPVLSGIDVIKRIRSPETFAHPDVAILMLTMHTERRYVLKALGFGANEYLAKPTSTAALRDRLLSALYRRSSMVKLGEFYVPKPRVWPPQANSTA
jgi:two-component system chemotaxis response regulator CheY